MQKHEQANKLFYFGATLQHLLLLIGAHSAPGQQLDAAQLLQTTTITHDGVHLKAQYVLSSPNNA